MGLVDMSRKEIHIRLGTVPSPVQPLRTTWRGTLDYLNRLGSSVWETLIEDDVLVLTIARRPYHLDSDSMRRGKGKSRIYLQSGRSRALKRSLCYTTKHALGSVNHSSEQQRSRIDCPME